MRLLYFLFAFFFCLPLFSQNKQTVSGQIKDAESGEDLIGAAVLVQELPGTGATANEYGFYSLTLPEGNYVLTVFYPGFKGQRHAIVLAADLRLDLRLSPEETLLQGVDVRAERPADNVEGAQMGTNELKMEQMEKLPALFGEVDVMKTLDLLPGVLAAGEGSSGFYVRGGGPDQNLVLLDEATIYNPGHLFGFFSVFNSDALSSTTLIKGSFPAEYGGRISSVVDVKMREGNNQRFGVEGGIGAIASRLLVEGPILKEKASFLVCARRTYAVDLAQPILRGTNFAGTNYFFYDINAKANWTLSSRDRLFLSGYYGRDVFSFKVNDRDIEFTAPWGNGTASLRWNHLFGDKLFANLAVIFNDYQFRFEGRQDQFTFAARSGIRSVQAKYRLDCYPNPRHKVKFGAEYAYHVFTPNLATLTSAADVFLVRPPKKHAQEAALFVQDEMVLSPDVTLFAGLRFSAFQQVGPYVSGLTGNSYNTLQPVKTYGGIEPRINLKWSLDNRSSIKGGVAVANQYMHLVALSTSTLPTDLWVPSTERVKPQIGVQYALGYFRNFKDNMFEASIEVYYKNLYNQLDYAEDFVPDINTDNELAFVQGVGRSFGAEFFVKKRKGKLNGWVGYTLARAERNFDAIAGGTFPARFDRTHDLSLAVNYELNPKWSFGAVFVYNSGNTYTPIKSLYLINFAPAVEYGVRNSARLPDYHRLDLSATWVPSAGKDKRFRSSWSFSIYNVYSRQNVFFTYTDPVADALGGTLQNQAYQVSLFPIIPSVTWNFKWE